MGVPTYPQVFLPTGVSDASGAASNGSSTAANVSHVPARAVSASSTLWGSPMGCVVTTTRCILQRTHTGVVPSKLKVILG